MSAKRTTSKRDPRLLWTAGVVAVAAVITIFVLVSGSGESPRVEGSVGIEEPVRFKVDSAGCGYSDVFTATGETISPEKGQFCVVRMEVRNLESPVHQLLASCQYVIDGSGARVPPRLDSEGLRSLADLDERLGPNEFRRASALYYDVSKETEIAAVELHSTCDSEGIRIDAASVASA